MSSKATCTLIHYDILLHILESLSGDNGTLKQCALVNREFNRAASSVLYARVKLSPPFKRVLDLKDRGELPTPSMFMSACSSRNALLVVELEISGYLSARPPPRNVLSSTLSNALRMFKNLTSLTLTPSTYHEDLLVESLSVLKRSVHLTTLTVNSSCMSEATAPILTEIDRIKKVTLYGPRRTILDLLPDWLRRLSKVLTGLHLKDNCGSITPGVLRSFIPHVGKNLREFTLGLSYSLTDEDVFSFIAQLPRLERLQLQYYLQLKKPSVIPNLSQLRYFAVNHSVMHTKREVNILCKWIRTVISSSPIEYLRIVCDDGESIGANVGFDSIIDHLVKKHFGSLRVLDFRSAYIKVDAARALFTRCLQLEEFCVSTGKNALAIFRECSPGMQRLHTAAFEIRNVKRKWGVVDGELASKIIGGGPLSLRRLEVNGIKWQVGVLASPCYLSFC
ncbi:hypothetical protein L208DRAFT_1424107 [Tricholoma matsutake]|nr:hypothetical protein L208DRAFT_1424107 [Tricholoma matsutake 945]